MYKSQKKTLEKYKELLITTAKGSDLIGEGLKRKKEKKLVKPKRGRGRPKTNPDIIIYENPNQLVRQLQEDLAALHAGNNGVYNIAVSILDELLRISAINKKDYTEIYKNNFNCLI